MISKLLFSLLLIFFLLPGCKEPQNQPEEEIRPAEAIPQRGTGCKYCHFETQADPSHDFGCQECHNGNSEATELPSAHQGLIAHPGHPEVLSETCGRCHPDQVSSCMNSLHFTLKNEINLVRKKFGATTELAGLTDIPESDATRDALSLADDLLRRRCLRCHVYTSGDKYPYTFRGQGCAACHMRFVDQELVNHSIIKTPGDQQCLSCHYGNFAGADYYGSFEHDFNEEFRTPYTSKGPYFRPYGVEQHNLSPDIHQQRGISCVDCHGGDELMGVSPGSKLSCAGCHGDLETRQALAIEYQNLYLEKEQLYLRSKGSGKDHQIPQLKHPAHAEYQGKVACQVCHAQWSYNDSSTHLLLSESDDYYPWYKLIVQGSQTVEELLEHNINSDEDEKDPLMADSITAKNKYGLWYKGFVQRRWTDMIIRKDSDGIFKVFRPILDIHLSAMDEDETVIFDNIQGNDTRLLPYTPHTTGPAGLFYKLRFSDPERMKNSKDKVPDD